MSLYLHYVKAVARRINAETPWERSRLIKKGGKFAKGFSPSGDARVTAWPCFESAEGPVVPVPERIFEYAFTVEMCVAHGIMGKDVLDVGSSGSILPGIVASLGNRVTCIDVREWPVQVKNLKFKKCDLLDCDIPKGSFDAVTCVSTVEHIGLGRYGDKEDPDGDVKGLALLREFLKPGGLLILTAPFGSAGVAFPAHRIYDRGRFERLAEGF
jgi:2-polyprenyl-3-methyl-5-hydroxy-6-metoxy-1,4-benzoquinol methylase